MWCLGRLLLLMIGADMQHHNQHWECFLLMMTIVDYVFGTVTSMEVLDYLKDFIQTHRHLFKELYASPIIPKLHYIIHIPQWIERFFGTHDENLLCHVCNYYVHVGVVLSHSCGI